MRVSINLATRPFVELRPLYARLRLVMAALALTAILLGIGLHLLDAQARAEQAQIDALKAQTSAVQQERQTNQARMEEPQNRAELERSKFLNNLFARKSFSWTSVMMDLERVLPAGVQVTSIDPSISAEGNVNIRLRVDGPRDLAVNLIRNLELSQRFLTPRLANETAQTQEHEGMRPASAIGVPGGVEFDITSGYNPLPTVGKDKSQKQDGAARKDVTPNNTAQKGAAQTGKASASRTRQNRLKPRGSAKSPIHKPTPYTTLPGHAAASRSKAGATHPASSNRTTTDARPSAAPDSTKNGRAKAVGGVR